MKKKSIVNDKKLSDEAIAILRQAKIDLLSEPENYDQFEPVVPGRDITGRKHHCQSKGCIYGYIGMRKKIYSELERRINSELLGLSNWHTGAKGYSLYEWWPEELRDAYNSAKTPLDKAVAGACAIELFIITDGFTNF